MKRIGASPEQFMAGQEEYYRYLDNLAPIDMSYVATWKERSRCENSLVFKLNDGPHPERITSREDFPPAARALGSSPNATKDGWILTSRKMKESNIRRRIATSS